MLDIRSRQSIREFLIQAGIGAAIMLALFAAGSQTWRELGNSAVRVFAFYAVMDCIRAAHGRETLARGSLNRWDQAAAYIGFALLLDVVLQCSRA